MAKFKFYVSTRYVGSERRGECEIPDEELEGKPEFERMKIIEEYFNDWLWDNIDAGWFEVEE